MTDPTEFIGGQIEYVPVERVRQLFDETKAKDAEIARMLGILNAASDIAEDAGRPEGERVDLSLQELVKEIATTHAELIGYREKLGACEVQNRRLKDANSRWKEGGDCLQSCLKDIGSDGSIYRSVFDEAVAVLRHWRKLIDDKNYELADCKAEFERLRAALAKYADRSRWSPSDVWIGETSTDESRGWRIAEEALK